jgi:hypothetical protein
MAIWYDASGFCCLIVELAGVCTTEERLLCQVGEYFAFGVKGVAPGLLCATALLERFGGYYSLELQ